MTRETENETILVSVRLSTELAAYKHWHYQERERESILPECEKEIYGKCEGVSKNIHI